MALRHPDSLHHSFRRNSNSRFGIRAASQWLAGMCICGQSCPLQGLCSTYVRAWMSQLWHLSMAVHLMFPLRRVIAIRHGQTGSSAGSTQHAHTPKWTHTHTHIHALFTPTEAIMTVLMVSAIKGERISHESHEGQQISTSQTQAC